MCNNIFQMYCIVISVAISMFRLKQSLFGSMLKGPTSYLEEDFSFFSINVSVGPRPCPSFKMLTPLEFDATDFLFSREAERLSNKRSLKRIRQRAKP